MGRAFSGVAAARPDGDPASDRRGQPGDTVGLSMATVATRLLTYEEWLVMPPVEDGIEEVVNGELRFMGSTRYPHAEIIQNLIDVLVGQIDKKRVRVLGSNIGLMISRDPLTCRAPDLVLFSRE